MDTGLRLSSSDLSVVSAYSAPSRFLQPPRAPRPRNEGSSLWSERRGFREDPCPLGAARPRGPPGPPPSLQRDFRLLGHSLLHSPSFGHLLTHRVTPELPSMPPRPGRLAEMSQHPQCRPDAGTMTRRNSTSEHALLLPFRATGSAPSRPF